MSGVKVPSKSPHAKRIGLDRQGLIYELIYSRRRVTFTLPRCFWGNIEDVSPKVWAALSDQSEDASSRNMVLERTKSLQGEIERIQTNTQSLATEAATADELPVVPTNLVSPHSSPSPSRNDALQSSRDISTTPTGRARRQSVSEKVSRLTFAFSHFSQS